MTNSLFQFRTEYREYCLECNDEGIMPNSFRDWFTGLNYYDFQDDKDIPEYEPFAHLFN